MTYHVRSVAKAHEVPRISETIFIARELVVALQSLTW